MRRLVLVVAAASKLVFIGLVLLTGRQYLGHALVPVVVDSVMIVLFIAYLIAPRRAVAQSPASAVRQGVR